MPSHPKKMCLLPFTPTILAAARGRADAEVEEEVQDGDASEEGVSEDGGADADRKVKQRCLEGSGIDDDDNDVNGDTDW